MKTKLSMVVLAAIGMVSLGNAVELKTTGEAVLYYQTVDTGANSDLFKQADSAANVGLRVNVTGDLGNDFGVGLEGVALGTLGLEKNLVDDTMMKKDGVNAAPLNWTAISQAYLTKKIDNTTIKAGRQAIPAAVSPLAFSEDWNVFANTYDAAVVINSDLPDTTLVGAWVSGNGNSTNLRVNNKAALDVEGGAYMVTAVNKSVKELPLTLSYYAMKDVDLTAAGVGKNGADAIWASTKVDAGLPVSLALQGGQINPKHAGTKDTTAFGAEIGAKVDMFDLGLAYSSVNNGTANVQNVGGQKTPLFTQMVANEGAIANDADTVVLKASTAVGAGTLSAAYGMVSAGAANSDSQELNLVYGFKALGTDMLLGYVNQDGDALADSTNIVRFVSRYNF